MAVILVIVGQLILVVLLLRWRRRRRQGEASVQSAVAEAGAAASEASGSADCAPLPPPEPSAWAVSPAPPSVPWTRQTEPRHYSRPGSLRAAPLVKSRPLEAVGPAQPTAPVSEGTQPSALQTLAGCEPQTAPPRGSAQLAPAEVPAPLTTPTAAVPVPLTTPAGAVPTRTSPVRATPDTSPARFSSVGGRARARPVPTLQEAAAARSAAAAALSAAALAAAESLAARQAEEEARVTLAAWAAAADSHERRKPREEGPPAASVRNQADIGPGTTAVGASPRGPGRPAPPGAAWVTPAFEPSGAEQRAEALSAGSTFAATPLASLLLPSSADVTRLGVSRRSRGSNEGHLEGGDATRLAGALTRVSIVGAGSGALLIGGEPEGSTPGVLYPPHPRRNALSSARSVLQSAQSASDGATGVLVPSVAPGSPPARSSSLRVLRGGPEGVPAPSRVASAAGRYSLQG